MVDERKPHQLIWRMLSDLGGASSVAMVSLSQQVGATFGAQAGEAKLRDVITAGGFGSADALPKTRST